jgi:hypothetical protein
VDVVAEDDTLFACSDGQVESVVPRRKRAVVVRREAARWHECPVEVEHDSAWVAESAVVGTLDEQEPT